IAQNPAKYYTRDQLLGNTAYTGLQPRYIRKYELDRRFRRTFLKDTQDFPRIDIQQTRNNTNSAVSG
ncbi:MAG: hypothetical protein VX809_09460, partial [Pseudomonadota bacterium]|nr:hypothetical protein [Pseudomonadota bacterium]